MGCGERVPAPAPAVPHRERGRGRGLCLEEMVGQPEMGQAAGALALANLPWLKSRLLPILRRCNCRWDRQQRGQRERRGQRGRLLPLP